jgi:hypothetical protein
MLENMNNNVYNACNIILMYYDSPGIHHVVNEVPFCVTYIFEILIKYRLVEMIIIVALLNRCYTAMLVESAKHSKLLAYKYW